MRKIPNSPRFIKLVFVNEVAKALVYHPAGKPIQKRLLTSDIIAQMLDCVKELHVNGIIHRDLSPNHFLQHNDQIFLIDFGCAIFTKNINDEDLNKSDNEDDKNYNNYKGSIQFAALDILTHLNK